MNNFTVVDFRFADNRDDFDIKYQAWSRIYEYKYVIDYIKNLNSISIPLIHNTSWGFEGVHVTFRDELDDIGDCIHSDIVNSEYRNTYYYDITTENKEFENKFDFVINISTIEHLDSVENRLLSIENLYKQLKPNGYLLLTFDFPRVSLDEIEKLVGSKCSDCGLNRLNGLNSKAIDERYKDLNIIYLILRKDE